MEGPGRSRSITPQFVMGVLIIVVGVVFTLENLGFIEAASYLRFWPVALIAVGLMKLWSGGRGGPLHGLLFFFAGVWLLLESMSIVSISLWALWPVLLIVAGGSMVWKGINGPAWQRDGFRHPLDGERGGGPRRLNRAQQFARRSAAAI